MKIISNNFNLPEVIGALNQGQTLIYPTETSYGLGCDATNQVAVNNVFKIKARDPQKPVLIIISELDQIKPFINWDERLEIINKKYWPGPLTVIVEAKNPNQLATGVISGEGLVAFRVTSNQLARELIEGLGRPLVSTSANQTGELPLYTTSEIIAKFGTVPNQPDLFIDGGDLPKILPSTIIKLVAGGIEIIRQGALTIEL